jgi:hypothetical protein
MVHAKRSPSRSGRTVGAGLLVVLLTGTARAEEVVPLDENTALMVGRHQLKLGVLAFEYGITQRVSVGMAAPAWLAGAFSPLFAPNLHLEVGLLDRAPVAVSALLGGYYVRLKDNGETGQLLSIPASLYGSVNVAPRLWLHGELNYNWVRAIGDVAVNTSQVEGATATRNGQVGLAADYHLTRVVALTARGRYQLWSSPLVLTGTSTIDAFTDAELGAELRPDRHPWMAVAGVAFTWKHVGLMVGGGYGHFFVPGANVATRSAGFVPDGSFWVTF